MNTQPVDVLAVMDRLVGNTRTMAGLSGDQRMRENLRAGVEARDAVRELIEANEEYDNARADEDGIRVLNAIVRRHEALARCKGGQP